jgi:beta-barrel assembly-enhancing protease
MKMQSHGVKFRAPAWKASAMRMVRPQRLPALLTALMLLIPAPLTCRQRDLDNLDKIGHRRIAHSCVIPPDKETAIARQYAAQFEQHAEIIRNPVIQAYFTKVAERIARNSDWKGPVRVRLVDSPEVNSFSLPSGLIYLASGLVLNAENEDQVAAVIAHQVAHAAARHWAASMTRATILQFAMIPMMFIPYDAVPSACSGFVPYRRGSTSSPSAASPGLIQACMGGVPLGFVKFIRQDELEADYLGLQYVYKAGYDPNAYVRFLRKLASLQPASSNKPDSFQDMAPYPERIARAEEEIRRILPGTPSPVKPRSP